MTRKPEHYPVWLRKILFDPISGFPDNIYYNPERNWDTLLKIKTESYRTNPKDALIFEMMIEMERTNIRNEERFCAITKELLSLKEKIKKLEKSL